MNRLIYFHPETLEAEKNHALPGMRTFAEFSKLFKSHICFVDRSGTVKTPVKTKSLFPLPPFCPFTRSFEEICNERAEELLRRSREESLPIAALWSGGIDSTLVLVSLLKNAKQEDLERISVYMSDDSIRENPNFYRDHLRGRVKCESSTLFFYALGGKHILVSGELNDQVFGAESTHGFMEQFGAKSIHESYSREKYLKFFRAKELSERMSVFYTNMLEKFKDAAPIPIVTNHDVNWWFSFAVKWQSVFMRTLVFAADRAVPHITEEYVQKRYQPFYNTEDFQLWSMNNLDKRIKDSWETYKWPAKDIIYDYTKDAHYRDTKVKRGSLHSIIVRQKKFPLVDGGFHFLNDDSLAAFGEQKNDFL